MSLNTGTRLGRYEIRAKIGKGGMGEVNLAEDTRLHRNVALKILPGELASHKDRMRRFEQEAQAAAALNHPNIATIYEIGDDEGTRFIAMEFIDGQTLRQKIHGEPTELRKLLGCLQHAAEGLAKAHVAGIEEAIAEFRQLLNLAPGKPLGIAGLAHVYALAGKRAEAQKALAELLELAKQRYVPPASIAMIYGALGDKDKAFVWLEQADSTRDALLARLKVDSRFDSLRSDRRFAEFVRRAGLPL
jgi:tetratricopeptide (TPR) repeat protein